jgi:hypothetical protein
MRWLPPLVSVCEGSDTFGYAGPSVHESPLVRLAANLNAG